MKLADRSIVITGGSRGIGLAIAEACSKEGALVHLVARNESELKAAQSSLTPGHIRTWVCDVSDRTQIVALLETIDRESPVHGLVCAAGVLGPTGPLETAALDDIEKTVGINLLGSLYAAHTLLPLMKRRGAGRIVLFSGGGQGPHPFRTAYAATKGAIWRLTESLGQESLESGVFVNAIAPGAVNTVFLEDVLKAGPGKVGDKVYAEAVQQKEKGGVPAQKAADLAVYLLSDKAHGLSGKTLSAVWDPYDSFENLAELSRSKWYTYSRLVPPTST